MSVLDETGQKSNTQVQKVVIIINQYSIPHPPPNIQQSDHMMKSRPQTNKTSSVMMHGWGEGEGEG